MHFEMCLRPSREALAGLEQAMKGRVEIGRPPKKGWQRVEKGKPIETDVFRCWRKLRVTTDSTCQIVITTGYQKRYQFRPANLGRKPLRALMP